MHRDNRIRLPALTRLFAKIRLWLRAHRPLAWTDALAPDYRAWAPDPPVIERLIR
jgi:hypothetical protein